MKEKVRSGKGGIVENFIWEIELAWKYDDDGQQIFENGIGRITNKFDRDVNRVEEQTKND